MSFVKRNEKGLIVAISQAQGAGFTEELPSGNEELTAFLGSMDAAPQSIDATDLGFVRVQEDVIELLIEKGVILFTDLPASAQEKIMLRQQMRANLGARLDLIGDD
jgi:hypothetical protein